MIEVTTPAYDAAAPAYAVARPSIASKFIPYTPLREEQKKGKKKFMPYTPEKTKKKEEKRQDVKKRKPGQWRRDGIDACRS